MPTLHDLPTIERSAVVAGLKIYVRLRGQNELMGPYLVSEDLNDKRLTGPSGEVYSLSSYSSNYVFYYDGISTPQSSILKTYVKDAVRTEAPLPMEVLGRMSNCGRVIHAIFGMITELGELVDQYKRHIFYGTKLDVVNVWEEIGDKFWYVAILLDATGGDIETIMRNNIAKLKKRYPEKFNETHAVERDLDAERKEL